jgi:hypothetical protein
MQLPVRSIADDRDVNDNLWPEREARSGSGCAFHEDSPHPFKNRPGVGWMLYLPVCSHPPSCARPRALVPVMRDEPQIGTIIVSVIDAVFDASNDEHVSVARAIETRLVSNDWLPMWEQMAGPVPDRSWP